MISIGGLNTFERLLDDGRTASRGVMINFPQWRKVHATEAFGASVETAFAELECCLVRVETATKNDP